MVNACHAKLKNWQKKCGKLMGGSIGGKKNISFQKTQGEQGDDFAGSNF